MEEDGLQKKNALIDLDFQIELMIFVLFVIFFCLDFFSFFCFCFVFGLLLSHHLNKFLYNIISHILDNNIKLSTLTISQIFSVIL